MVVIVTITLSLLAKERTPIQERGAFFFLFSKFKDILGRSSWARGAPPAAAQPLRNFFQSTTFSPFFRHPNGSYRKGAR